MEMDSPVKVKLTSHQPVINQFYADIDECTTGQHGCNENANCMNTLGSYVCQCFNSFIGDGHQCTRK